MHRSLIWQKLHLRFHFHLHLFHFPPPFALSLIFSFYLSHSLSPSIFLFVSLSLLLNVSPVLPISHSLPPLLLPLTHSFSRSIKRNHQQRRRDHLPLWNRRGCSAVPIREGSPGLLGPTRAGAPSSSSFPSLSVLCFSINALPIFSSPLSVLFLIHPCDIFYYSACFIMSIYI